MTKRHKSSAAERPAKPRINVRPLVVGTAEAGRLGGWGKTRVFQLIAAGELESYLDGRVRRITVESIEARIHRKLEESRRTEARPETNAGPRGGRRNFFAEITNPTLGGVDTTKGSRRAEFS